ncbi:ABC transporter substrate-binding protein [Bifidobacterium jacchi]|uniref:ABC transporter substrate-binding protein n=1 Tax=Bifidobacterium jacchi TaxID=2490545 RepID=A0A5N5RLZ0_9BIFI|nr:ABC transporter substrate-binding protein [Bifidobacterium jacchi]KAB5608133.1 ABC transporter substrate-binding protein [Bifidobacterium jacchi]
MHRKHSSALISWLIFTAVLVALSAIVWVGWSLANHRSIIPQSPDSYSVQSDSAITVGLKGSPQSLDIRSNGDQEIERALIGNVYETLVSRSEDNTLEPGLAQRWEISKDGLTYTFTLREGTSFSNGDNLDASDVILSLQQLVKRQYIGADALKDLKSVSNPDARTVVITLSKPNPQLLRALSGRAGIIYDADVTLSYESKALGSGPFVVTGFEKGSTISLERNERYWGTAAKTGHITLRYYGDDKQLSKALTDGTVNVAFGLPGATAQSLGKANPGLTVESGTTTTNVMLALNNSTDSIFSDQQARQVIRHAVDNASIAKSQPDAAKALGGPIGPLSPGYEDLTGLFPFDQNKAVSMIYYFAGAAGYFGTLDFVVPQRYAAIGNTVTEQLQAVGLSVNMETVDDATAAKRLKSGDYTLMVTTDAIVGDASVFGSSNNLLHYNSGEAQQAWKAAEAATNDDDYRSRLAAYAKIVSQDAASDWLYAERAWVAADSKISGYPKNLTDERLPLANLQI